MRAAKVQDVIQAAKECETFYDLVNVLSVSPATVSRRLKDAGTTFREIKGNPPKKHKRAARGERFGRWTVVSDNGSDVFVKCDCGSRSYVKLYSLRNGETKSCGCLKRDMIIERSTKHGKCGSPEYNTWMGMRSRCHNQNAANYHWYGAKGVSVCKEWRNDFSRFLEDMGPRPSENHSLDRIDPFGDYTPSNCRWATHKEQMNNQRKHHATS